MARVHAQACALRHVWAFLLSAAVEEVVFIIIVTEFVDALTIDPIVASRLILLDKGNCEVRPMGARGRGDWKNNWQMRH